MLGRRILTALVLLPAAFAALFLLPNGGWAFAAGAVMAIGANEWARLAKWSPAARFGFVGAVVVSMGLLFQLPRDSAIPSWVLAAATAFWITIVLPWLRGRWRIDNDWRMALTGWWVLVPAWFATVLLQVEPARLLALMAVVWIADTSAYFAGRKFGRRKLAPEISPGKSWEGVIGALFGVAIYYAAMHALRPDVLPHLPFAGGLAFFVVLTALSVVGDLFESWMKRVAGVKDSGTLLPGHGGILDRVDALTASLPLAALVVRLAG